METPILRNSYLTRKKKFKWAILIVAMEYFVLNLHIPFYIFLYSLRGAWQYETVPFH